MGYNEGSSDNGNVAYWNATGWLSFVRSYSYDGVNRLSALSDSVSSNPCNGLTWSYDAWGNRTAQSISPGASSCGTWSAGYNSANQINSGGFTYDAAGNLIADGEHTYSYDAENRLTKVDGGSTASYSYDADGNRTEKTADGLSMEYIYDTSGEIVAEDNGTSWWTGYVYADGQMIAQYDSDATRFIHQDHLGSTRMVTELNGNMLDSLDFLPFGEQIAGDSATSHKFTGYQRDPETNLDDALARYYGSSYGRFMSPDPENAGADISDPQTLNMYAYVENNPLNLTDPTGMQQSRGNEPADSCNGTGTGFEECIGAYFNCFYIDTCNPNDPKTWPPPHDAGLCTANNIQMDCEYVFDALHADAADICPDNNCHLVTHDPYGNLYRWVPAPTPIPDTCNTSTAICRDTYKQLSHWEAVDTDDSRIKMTTGLTGLEADFYMHKYGIPMATLEGIGLGAAFAPEIAAGYRTAKTMVYVHPQLIQFGQGYVSAISHRGISTPNTPAGWAGNITARLTPLGAAWFYKKR